MKIIKFGGKSLAFDAGFQNVISIIMEKSNAPIAVVVSAIGQTTNQLEALLVQAEKGESYHKNLICFRQQPQHEKIDLRDEFSVLEKELQSAFVQKKSNAQQKDLVLAQGEIISAKIVAHHLRQKGRDARFVDSRAFLITDEQYGEAQPLHSISSKKTIEYFNTFPSNSLPIITGFIGASVHGATTTLGRNGSNYSASLIANYLQAEEMQNYTHVDGIFTANPEWIPDAQKIDHLHYQEANELAQFGASILHAKTIAPLIASEIPLRILNTFSPNGNGTLISSQPTSHGIRSVTVQDQVALIVFEGKGLLGKVGIDARIFSVLSRHHISVSVISQGVSERGIGFIVPLKHAQIAVNALQKEFENDILQQDVSSITFTDNIAVISIIGQSLRTFHQPYNALIENKITPILFNNTISGKNVGLVVAKSDAKKALHIIHGHIVGMTKKINLFIFGHGVVGKALIQQILQTTKDIETKKRITIQIVGIANSQKVILNAKGHDSNWEATLQKEGKSYELKDILEYAQKHHLENLMAVDNTASKEFTNQYLTFIENGFDLVSSNKHANTRHYSFYKGIRETLQKHHKNYLYETNVGAGLPLIDTIRLLHLSGENITKIKGVFSGTLSFLFNEFSADHASFDLILQKTIAAGYTEPDPRDDLSGQDVARKLLILARELDLENEIEEVKIQNLIPKELQKGHVQDFLNQLDDLNPIFENYKKNQPKGNVLRYVGELSGDLQQKKGKLETKLISVSQKSALGNLQGSDSLFEIYTESYGDRPIVIQGAGAGAQVTARGVLGDILRIAEKNNYHHPSH